MPTLLTGATTQAAGASASWGGGAGIFEVAGAFNGATVTLQVKVLNGDGTYSYVDVANTALTASGQKSFTCAPGSIRANVTVAAPTSVSSAAWRVRNP